MSTIGINDHEKKLMNKILHDKYFYCHQEFEFQINLEKYGSDEFLSDLDLVKNQLKTNNNTEGNYEEVFILFKLSVGFNLMNREDINKISNGFEKMKDAIEKHLNDEKNPKNIKDRFMNKLDEIRKQSIESVPTDQEIKIWCLRNEQNRYNSYGQGYKGNTPETDRYVLKSIKQFFSSTSTQKEKEAAQKKLQDFYKNERDVLPLYIEKKIFPEQAGFYESCFLPTKIIDHEPLRMISRPPSSEQ